ncbi:tyrosinase [Sphaerisporangium krabiense]|uniref:Tyrosinase n=1 Tax=Sphaerisporangium krabiense TaxID=763782 RepID=A0A7W9DMW4_9ACTN|nr:tyrosinase family protein [Sphaerisporangium krabiense]MBB5624786.1 tyrosinase [Sphaerisporangium krabiense]GII66514.1 tyrosinase [Sphaerisporangium krabiense]
MGRIRKNHLDMTPEERRRFIGAVLEIKRRGVYDRFVQLHVDVNSKDYIDKDTGKRVGHINPGFLPWHRQYLLELENQLRRVDPSVTLPYWDWTTDQSRDSPLWADDFMGGDGRPEDGMVMTGPFAYPNGWKLKVNVQPAGTEDPALNGHYTVDDREFLIRRIGQKISRLPTPEQLGQTLDLPVYDCDPWDYTSGGVAPYNSFRNHLEGYTNFPWEPAAGKLHGAGHQWVGGHMMYIASPNDPVFFLHHCFIDKCWADWQARHPGVPHYLPVEPTPEVPDVTTSLFPWHTKRVRDLIDHTPYYRYA